MSFVASFKSAIFVGLLFSVMADVKSSARDVFEALIDEDAAWNELAAHSCDPKN